MDRTEAFEQVKTALERRADELQRLQDLCYGDAEADSDRDEWGYSYSTDDHGQKIDIELDVTGAVEEYDFLVALANKAIPLIRDLLAENARLRVALTMADGTAPCSKWKTHQGVETLEDFVAWVDGKLREYLLLAARSKDPELGDWLAARKGTFEEVKLNLARALSAPPPQRDDGRLAGWRPIDSAPRDGTRVLICCSRGRISAAEWQRMPFVGEGWFVPVPILHGSGCGTDNFIHFDEDAPTHWMPLPATPKQEG